MVSFATCSFSVDEAFACLFTHRRVSVFIITRRIHSSQAFQSFRIEQRAIHSGSPHSIQPSLNWGQSSAGQAIQDQQAKPLSSDQQQVGSAGQSSRIRPELGQNSESGAGQSGSSSGHQASQDHNPSQLSSFLLSTSYRRWRAAIHVWLGRVQLIRSCIKGIGKYKQRRSQRTHT